MIRVLYITRAKLSLSRAHTLNIIKTAEYINKDNDITVNVLSTAAEGKDIDAIFSKKNVKAEFGVDVSSGRRNLFREIIKKRNSFDVLYFRDPFIWYIAFFTKAVLRKEVVFEVHGSHEWRYGWPFWRLAIRSSNGIIFITSLLKKYYNSSKKKQLVVHSSGVEMEDFIINEDINILRKELNLPLEKRIILFTGSFLWHSCDLLLDIASKFPPHIMMVIVGIKDDELNKIKKTRNKEIQNKIIFVNRISHREVVKYLKASDVLINTLKLDYPGSVSSKIFEYLAAGKPIVSSGGRANLDILKHNVNSIIVDSPTPSNYYEAIEEVLNDKQLSQSIGSNAKESSLKYTWEKRGKEISLFIKGM